MTDVPEPATTPSQAPPVVVTGDPLTIDDVVDVATAGSAVRVLVVPTDEEREIATQSLAAVSS